MCGQVLARYSYHRALKLLTCLNFASFATLDVSLIIWPFSLDPSKTVSFFLFEIVVKSRWHWHWIETCIGRALKIGHTSRRSLGNSSSNAVGHTFGHATHSQCNLCSKWSCWMRYFSDAISATSSLCGLGETLNSEYKGTDTFSCHIFWTIKLRLKSTQAIILQINKYLRNALRAEIDSKDLTDWQCVFKHHSF